MWLEKRAHLYYMQRSVFERDHGRGPFSLATAPGLSRADYFLPAVLIFHSQLRGTIVQRAVPEQSQGKRKSETNKNKSNKKSKRKKKRLVHLGTRIGT
jgi:hypothetical protein